MKILLFRIMTVIVLSWSLIVASNVRLYAQDTAAAEASGDPSSNKMDPKLKILLTMAGYGTVGGALLGAASMAYGARFRAIAVGASLGLYVGLIFGGYVLVTHHYSRQTIEGTGPGNLGPYQEFGLERFDHSLLFERETRRIGVSKLSTIDAPAIQNDISFYFDLFKYQF